MTAVGPTVLAVDAAAADQAVLGALLAEVMPRARFLSAPGGEQGLELALRHDPDVILLDTVMPGMDGFEVCRRLKGDPRLEHIPVVFLTSAQANRRSRLRALALGAEAFLAKPVDAFELEAQVRAMAKIKAGAERRRRESNPKPAEREALEARVVQQQKLELLGTLVGGLAHDINNPIAVILSSAELILDDAPPGSPIATNAARAIEAAGRVGTILRNLQSFARQDREAMEPVPMGQVVESTFSLVQKLFERERIACRVDVAADLPGVLGRSGQLAQVLMNLLTNARDAVTQRPAGGPADRLVDVRVRATEQEGRRWVCLSVEDNGPGVDDATRARLFDPFFTTKPRDAGTGLGLSISHGIVAEHGGRIGYEPREGGRARFVVLLPAVPS